MEIEIKWVGQDGQSYRLYQDDLHTLDDINKFIQDVLYVQGEMPPKCFPEGTTPNGY